MRVDRDLELRKDAAVRLQSVEFVRFLAAFSVILFHYQQFFFGGNILSQSPSLRELLPLSGTLSIFYYSGHYGVEWFWVLSGYVFFFNYRDTLANQSITGFAFFSRRFARLYPLHFATLLVVSLLLLSYRSLFKVSYPLYAGGNVWSFISQLFMTSNWAAFNYTFNGPIWSVSVEVLIYILFFFLTKYGQIKGLAKTGAVAVAFFFLYYFATKRDFGTTVLIAQCAACFYLGGLMYEMQMHYKLDIAAGLRQSLFWAVVAATLFAFYQFRPAYALPFAVPASTILFVVCSGPIERSRIIGSLARLGNWTYSSYLLHFPVALLILIGLRISGLEVSAIARQPIFLGGYLVLVFVLSDLCYTFFEAPARRAIRIAADNIAAVPGRSARTVASDAP